MSNLDDAAIPVRRYVETYGLTAFIETGCYLGDGLHFAREQNLLLFSCDLNPNLVAKCRARFPQAQVYNMDSVSFLHEVCPHVAQRTLFWLDAHFPRNHERESPRFWPLFEELTAVKKLKPGVKHDVILCDDMLVIGGGNPRYRPGECKYVDTRHSLGEYAAIFSGTHRAHLIQEETGVLALLPNER